MTAEPLSRQSTCIVNGCETPGMERIVYEDIERNSIARAVLCDEHRHVLDPPHERMDHARPAA